VLLIAEKRLDSIFREAYSFADLGEENLKRKKERN
jgi:hypothetical protein